MCKQTKTYTSLATGFIVCRFILGLGVGVLVDVVGVGVTGDTLLSVGSFISLDPVGLVLVSCLARGESKKKKELKLGLYNHENIEAE